MTVLASFDVIGLPKAQGSKRAFVVKGKAQMSEAAGAAGAQWRDAVTVAAMREVDRLIDARTGNPELVPPFDGPLKLEVIFRFPMPAARNKRIREIGEWPKSTAPDTSKLVRSLEDGLQAAGLVVDDARFSNVWAMKVETTGWTGATVMIARENVS